MAAFNLDSIVDSVLSIDDTADLHRDTRVQVLVDESVDSKLIGRARAALTPSTDNISLTVGSFYADLVEIDPEADLVIVLANTSMWVGAIAAVAEASEIACVVIAQSVAAAVHNAEAIGFPLDPDNIVAKQLLEQEKVPGGNLIDIVVDACGGAVCEAFEIVAREIPQHVTGAPLAENSLEIELPRLGSQPVGYDELFEALGDWVMQNCPEFRDAFATAFDFAKLPQIRQIARRTAYENAVTGAIFFTPGADFPVMTLNQLKMLVEIGRAYGIAPDKQTVPEAVLVVASAFASRTFTRMLCKMFPLLSWFIKIVMGYLVTVVMGHVLSSYMQAGRMFPIERIGKLELNTDQLPTGRGVVAQID